MFHHRHLTTYPTNDKDGSEMISSLFLQLVVTVWIGAHPLTYTLPRIYWALQADSFVAKGQWLLAHAKAWIGDGHLLRPHRQARSLMEFRAQCAAG
jgi:hypothetical protein